MNVSFYTFSKKANSTAQPSGSPVYTAACNLKDASGIMRPVLEIYQGQSFNPYSLNYAYISSFGRYYYVIDWTYIGGRWEVSLQVDTLASYKTEIGSASKYVLRAAARYNPKIIDTFYPALGEQTYYSRTGHYFGFSGNYNTGVYILGIANNDASGAGAVSYYQMSSAEIKALVAYMLTPTSDDWSNPISGMTDTLYRAIYSPFDYIKSCKWFPYGPTSSASYQYLKFGNYTSNVQGRMLGNDSSGWDVLSHTFSMSAFVHDWNSLDAKFKTQPAAHMYMFFNPWGIIELNPMDFTPTNTSGIKVDVETDYISGESTLKIYRVEGQLNKIITQTSANLGIDINLSSSSINAGGLMGSYLAIGSGAIGIATGGVGLAAGALAVGSGVADGVMSSIPSASAAVGRQTAGAKQYDGLCDLIYTCQGYVPENNTEFGKPLYETVVLNTLSGYIKCGDGDISLDAFAEEAEEVSNYLTAGFYYE